MESSLSHRQAERLKFIDFRLLFFGFLNRANLIDRFGVAPAAATRDLKAYKDYASQNLDYDIKKKTYYAASTFRPAFAHDAGKALAFFEAETLDEQFQAAPIFCEAPTQLNHPDVDALSSVTRAIAQGKALKMTYFSLNSGKKQREIVPHCLVDNGLRWHVRAYDRVRQRFGDFVLNRIADAAPLEFVSERSHEGAREDRQWNRFVELEIVPHPNLSNKEAIEFEYQMKDGFLAVEVRAAIAGYLLRRWNVDCSEDHSLRTENKGLEFHLWLRNQVALYKTARLFLAPGYSPD